MTTRNTTEEVHEEEELQETEVEEPEVEENAEQEPEVEHDTPSDKGDLEKQLEALLPLKKEVGNYRRRAKDAETKAEAVTKERDEALEALDAMKESVLESKLIGAAAGKLADPQDVLRFVDREGLSWDSDLAAFAEAVDALVKTKPYLAHGTVPDGEQGPRGDNAPGKGDPNEWLRGKLRNG